MLPPDLVAKLNQCAGNDFVGPRDSWFNWLARFTTMVAVGLVLELPELVYELKLITREWIPYFRYRIRTPRERRLQTAKVVAFIGWILIVAGVVGERYAEVRVKDFDASIQGCSDAKVREATIEAGDAQTSAKGAADAAKRAKQEADQVTGIATAAKTGAADAERQVVNVQTQADSLNRDIAAEKEAFRRFTTWRSFTNKDEIISSLREFAKTQYQFQGVYGDEESEHLLREINDILAKADWTRVNPDLSGNSTTVDALEFGLGNERIPVVTSDGIHVSIQYPVSVKEINSLPEGARLQHLRAAEALVRLIWAGLFPPDEDTKRKTVLVDRGDSKVVRIIVGGKP